MADELDNAPSPAALRGLEEWWDNRLSLAEQRALSLLIADPLIPWTVPLVKWRSLSPQQRAALAGAFPRAVQLGIECALALDWKGIKGSGLDAEDEFRTLA